MTASGRDWGRLQNILPLLVVFSFCLYLPSAFHDAFADDEIYLAYANRFLHGANWLDLYQLFLKQVNPWGFLGVSQFEIFFL